MATMFIKDFREELRRGGEANFKVRHRTPLLVVTGRVAEIVGEGSMADRTAVASSRDPVRVGLAILDRVFPVVKGETSPRGPISIGRTAENDVAIPEASISRRHCLIDFDVGGAKIFDCGATNGLLLNGQKLGTKLSSPLRPGDEIALGRFSFRFHSPDSFLAFLKSLE